MSPAKKSAKEVVKSAKEAVKSAKEAVRKAESVSSSKSSSKKAVSDWTEDAPSKTKKTLARVAPVKAAPAPAPARKEASAKSDKSDKKVKPDNSDKKAKPEKLDKKAEKKAVAAGSGPATLPVRFQKFSPGSSSVAVAGSFNGWNPATTPMARDSEGMWTVVVDLAPGTYVYKLVFDGGTWEVDADRPTAKDEGGNTNNVVTVL